MKDQIRQRLADLRGTLPSEEPGARGIERLARNPACALLRSLTIAGITPATAATKVYGGTATEGQSPFALGVGNAFEHAILKNGAAKLLELLWESGRLPRNQRRVVVVANEVGGTDAGSLAKAEAVTNAFFRLKLAGDRRAPNIIVKPRLPIFILGLGHDVELDAVVAADRDRFYETIEIKSYIDRGSKTDPSDLRNAYQQTAVYVVGLRQAITKLGVSQAADELVPSTGKLILRRPGSFFPTLSHMALEGEVDALQRVLNTIPKNLDELEDLLHAIASTATLDDPKVLDRIPHNFVEGCREHCALAQRCKQRALCSGDPIILGETAREELAPVATLSRALELLYGRGRPAQSVEERAIQARLQAANKAFSEVMDYEY